MALGNSNPFQGYQRFYLGIKGADRDATDAYFEVSAKNDQSGKIEVLSGESGKTGSVSGKIVSIKKSSYQYGNDTIRKINIFMVDPSEGQVYKVEGGYNRFTRSIINTLASAEELKTPVQFRLYVGKEDGIGRAWVGQYVNGEAADPVRLDWSMSLEEQKPMVEEIYKMNSKGEKVGDPEKNYDKLNEHLFGPVLDEIVRKIDGTIPAPQGGGQAVQEFSSGEATPAQPEADPLDKINAASSGEPAASSATPPPADEEDDLPF